VAEEKIHQTANVRNISVMTELVNYMVIGDPELHLTSPICMQNYPHLVKCSHCKCHGIKLDEMKFMFRYFQFWFHFMELCPESCQKSKTLVDPLKLTPGLTKQIFWAKLF